MNQTITIADLLIKEQQQAAFDLINPLQKTDGNIRRTKGMAKMETYAENEDAMLLLVDALRRYPFDFRKDDPNYCALLALLAFSSHNSSQCYLYDLIQFYIQNHCVDELLFWSELLHVFTIKHKHLAFKYNIVAGFFYRARRKRRAGVQCSVSELELQTAERFMPELQPRTFYDTVMLCSESVWDPHLLAERCGYTYHTFRKIFSEQFGCTISQWMQKQRIFLIRHLLTTTNLEFKEVARRCGFSGDNYLWDFCRTHLHDTPKNLRHKWQERKDEIP